MMDQPNILLIVWDACRYDFAKENAPTLNSLADSNLWFENAITPAGWSLPAHASIFTGKYPHDHGIYRYEHNINSTPLVDELNKSGYKTAGVSANGYASPYYRFNSSFGDFYTTRGETVYPEGLDVYDLRRKIEENNEGELVFDPNTIVKELTHADEKIKSIANIFAGGISKFVVDYPWLQKIPHPRFNEYSGFCYSPTRNTQLITSLIDEYSNGKDSFFIFSNYMDTHRPYAPPKEYQKKYANKSYSYRELAEISSLCKPWDYIEKIERGEDISRQKKEEIKQLYRGEVRTADDHLNYLLEKLEDKGIIEDTLIIVTADHGENLGETDRMGKTRIGHVASASDNLTKVPLVVAHPDLPEAKIENHISVKEIRNMVTNHDIIDSSDTNSIINTFCEDPVFSQLPAIGNTNFYEKYPDIPKELFDQHICAGYSKDWKVVQTDTGEQWAWKSGEERDISEAPLELTEGIEQHLEELVRLDTSKEMVDGDTLSQMKKLGYI